MIPVDLLLLCSWTIISTVTVTKVLVQHYLLMISYVFLTFLSVLITYIFYNFIKIGVGGTLLLCLVLRAFCECDHNITGIFRRTSCLTLLRLVYFEYFAIFFLGDIINGFLGLNSTSHPIQCKFSLGALCIQ